MSNTLFDYSSNLSNQLNVRGSEGWQLVSTVCTGTETKFIFMQEVKLNVHHIVKSQLNTLKALFPKLSIRCEIKVNAIIIEILPLSEYEFNKEYSLKEKEIRTYLQDLFPSYDIVFVSENSLIKINTPTFII